MIKKIFRVVKVSILTLLALFIIWMGLSSLMTMNEKKQYKPNGDLVQVEDGLMHVYTQGEGDETILLMSGLGTVSPVTDFMPLIRVLSKDYKVVVVENFGYGWSDDTDKERSAKNIIEETRLALKGLNIEGPYILMPHSISGLYAMTYADLYPEEVKAVIGIDMSLPKQNEHFDVSYPKLPKAYSLLSPLGISRLILSINPNMFSPVDTSGFRDEEIDFMRTMSMWKGYNKTVVLETNHVQKNSEDLINKSFPEEIPLVLLVKELSKDRPDGKTKAGLAETYINNDQSKLVLMEGHHYLHWSNAKEMKEILDDLVESMN